MLTGLRVKICGLCAPEAARQAAQAGADYVGVIVGAPGARRQSPERAHAIFEAAPGLKRVGVFADAAFDETVRGAEALELDVLQLHGGEAPSLVRRLREAGPWTVWKAIRPRSAQEFEQAVALHAENVDGVLIDGWSAQGGGGTGTRFDWEVIAPLRARIGPHTLFIVAGGLTPDNVGTAIERLRPDIVDVSSGVESAPCEKSPERMRAFIVNAHAAAPHGGPAA